MRQAFRGELSSPGGAWLLVPAVLLGVVLQATAAPLIEIRGVRPDGLLVLVVLFGLRLPRAPAVVGAWSMGFLVEFLTIERMGLVSIAYAMTAWLLVTIRDALARESLVTEAVSTFVVSLIVFGSWLIYRVAAHGAPPDGATALWSDWIVRSAYTAAWTVPMHCLLWLANSVPFFRRTHTPATR